MATAANPALGGLAAGLLLMGWQNLPSNALMRRPITWKRCKPMGSLITQQALVKSLASLLVVTSGSAIGREGAMIL